MKKLVFLAILVCFVFSAPFVHAEQKYPLGFGNISLKVDYFRFMDDLFEDADMENGVFIGAEAYVGIPALPGLYLGVESGWAGTSGEQDFYVIDYPYGVHRIDADFDVSYVPIEFNAKYVFDINPCLTFDIGGGVSYNYFNLEADFGGWDDSIDDWVFGGQFFADINYKFNQCWFVGVNVKYQLTDDLEFDFAGGDFDTNVSADNLRVGGQIGFMF